MQNRRSVLFQSWQHLVVRQRRMIIDTILLGIVGALSAQLFTLLLKTAERYLIQGIAGYYQPGLPNEGGALTAFFGPHWFWLVPVVTTVGGLISGFIVYTWAPEAEGHGTDTAVKAFHRAGGLIRARVPPLKMIASAITIGSGGAAGREGPTALISAGIGSIYATITKRPEADRRLLVLIGMASGLSAIFRSPIGTAFFAIEVLYGGMEFETGALLYTMLGSVIAYALNGLFVGYSPLFAVPPQAAPTQFFDYGWYILLGIVAGLVATIIPMVFYGLRDVFAAIKIPAQFKPAIGGLGVGIIGMFLPQVLAGGYGWMQLAINGQLAIGLMLILVFAKLAAFALTISSGGSGGVFAPSLFVGAMLGGSMAGIFHQPASAFAIVGMAAVFGGAARVPVATLLMVTEMTGGYHLLVPAALSVMLSYLVETELSRHLKYQSLYEAQVLGRVYSPAHLSEDAQVIFRLISKQQLTALSNMPHLNLEALMASGAPIDLPDSKELVLGVLKADSHLIGRVIRSPYQLFFDRGQPNKETEMVAVIRNHHTILPHPNVILKEGDRVLAILSPKDLQQWRLHFGSPANGDGASGKVG